VFRALRPTPLTSRQLNSSRYPAQQVACYFFFLSHPRLLLRTIIKVCSSCFEHPRLPHRHNGWEGCDFFLGVLSSLTVDTLQA
jgi:hypothetical protein